MFREMDDTEADISIYDAAVRKYKGCSSAVTFYGQKTCRLFQFQMDNSADILAYCGSCIANTKKPTAKSKARFS